MKTTCCLAFIVLVLSVGCAEERADVVSVAVSEVGAASCGDATCDESELGGACPADCSWCGDGWCDPGNEEDEGSCAVDCATWCAAGSWIWTCPGDAACGAAANTCEAP